MGYKTEKRTTTRETTVITGARCDSCGAELRPVRHMANEDGTWGSAQPDDALEVRLIGGYGMYFDADESPLVVLCKSCADQLCEQWPVFRNAIRGLFAWIDEADGPENYGPSLAIKTDPEPPKDG